MWLFLSLMCAAVAETPPADQIEEVIVYSDDFARWDDTRWWVASEVILPLPLAFQRERSEGFRTFAFQTRMVIRCEKDAKLSKRKWEILCEIEDIGLLVTTARRWRREKDRALAQAVLDETDAKLTGMKIQLQVDKKGGVTNVGLEGLIASNSRERLIKENLRQVLLRAVVGFHLRIPDHAQREGQWIEYNSQLMSLPSLTGTRGSTTLVHTVSAHQGYQIVQTLGEGIIAINLPNFDAEMPTFTDFQSNSVAIAGTPGGGGIGASALDTSGFGDPDLAANPMPMSSKGEESEVQLSYKMSTTGVALFDKETGIMTERVWTSSGDPTASSAGGTFQLGYRNLGRVRQLGPEDRPAVGPTLQVAWPGLSMEGLAPWVDIETTPGQ